MKRDYKALAKEFMEMVGETTEATAFDVEVDDGINLVPRDSMGTFYHLEEVVDFCRVKKLCCYVYPHNETGKCIARMY